VYLTFNMCSTLSYVLNVYTTKMIDFVRSFVMHSKSDSQKWIALMSPRKAPQ